MCYSPGVAGQDFNESGNISTHPVCNSLGVAGQGFNESGNISTHPVVDSGFPARGVGSSNPQETSTPATIFPKTAVVNISGF